MTQPPTAGSLLPERFPPHSRYAACEVVTTTLPDGTERRHLTRRVIPEEPGAAIAEHLVTAGDRPDLLAHTYYGDPLLSWRIADANRVLDPAELVADPGRVLHVPAPGGTR